MASSVDYQLLESNVSSEETIEEDKKIHINDKEADKN